MTTYLKAAKKADVPPGRMTCVKLKGHRIAIYNLAGEYFATQESCTHAEASLCDGDISGDEVVCPLHFATFNIRTGECTGPPATEDLMTYAVRIVGDDIEVQV
ncbi:MAG TPA: non-heme iron oxygenase ferredoxin subunit [Phycisphaerales bacterium]|nr:non-heme iron oxygenase ferredoxin subunit [Phycisphaerales bacterium]HRQ75678.1 non-heme iron oxygenase ferredoxin subunit [Phycisphaerales bacterium]